MYTENFMNYMLAHIIYPTPYFNDTTWVNTNVLNWENITAEEQGYIYNDIRYGMSNERLLSIWIAATNGDEGAQAALANHWFSGKYQLPEGALASVTGASG
jgi:hypothetical protein